MLLHPPFLLVLLFLVLFLRYIFILRLLAVVFLSSQYSSANFSNPSALNSFCLPHPPSHPQAPPSLFALLHLSLLFFLILIFLGYYSSVRLAEWLWSPPLDQQIDIEGLCSNPGAGKLDSGTQLSV
jgi:hypothetical protein